MKRLKFSRGRVATCLYALAAVGCLVKPDALAGVGDVDLAFGAAGRFDYPAGFEGLVKLPGERLQLAAIEADVLKVRRFTAEGQPDTAFGTGGLLETPVTMGPTQVRSAIAGQAGATFLGLLSQGPTVSVQISPGTIAVVVQHETRLMRILPDGRPDASFGPDGTRRFPFTAVTGANISETMDMSVAPGGAVYLLVNYLPEYYECSLAYRLHRLLPSGEIDTAFGSGGFLALEAGCSVTPPRILALQDGVLVWTAGSATRLDAQGRSVAVPAAWRDAFANAGSVALASTASHVHAARASLTNGLTVDFTRWQHELVPDGTFGDSLSGSTSVAVGSLPFVPASIEAFRLLPPHSADEHLYAVIGVLSGAPSAGSIGRQFAEVLIRLRSGGTLDGAFGTAGVVIARTGGLLFPVAQRQDGSLVLATAYRRAIRLSGQDLGSPGLIELGLGCGSATGFSEKQKPLAISVWRTLGSQGAVTVAFSTRAGSAAPGSDYRDASGTLSWAAGETGERRIELELIDDETVEPQEEFRLNVSALSGNAPVSCAEARVLIVSDDSMTPSTAPPAASPGSSTQVSASPGSGGGGGRVDIALLALLVTLVWLRCPGPRQSRSRIR